jgi:hypothetical protein
MTLAPHERHLRILAHVDHDDCRNPRSSQDCKSRWRRTWIWKLCSTTACSGGVISHPRSPSGGHAGEGEGGGGRRPGGGGGRRLEGGGARGTCVSSPPLGPLYLGGGGAPYPLHKPPMAAAKGGAKGAAARARASRPSPRNPKPIKGAPRVSWASSLGEAQKGRN